MRTRHGIALSLVLFGFSGLSLWADPASHTQALRDLPATALRQQCVALPKAGFTEIDKREAREGIRPGTILLKFRGDRYVSVLNVPAGREQGSVQALRARLDIAFAEVDALMQRQTVPDDSLYGQQWHHARIGSAAARDYAPGNAGIRIAIVDAPYQMNHPDLAANTDNGWDVVNETMVTSSQIPSVYAYDDHATASAGMAAAVVNNALGVAGAGNCRILPIRINGFISEMYNATLWAASNNVRIVNISWDGADSATLNEAGRFLREEIDGILVMAGVNGTGLLDYTNHPYITCVSMTDSNDLLRSHFGPHIDFSAPGWDVFSTRTVSAYGTQQGTSFAAPLVSGILGAMLAVEPTLSAVDVLSALRHSAVDLGASGWDTHYGWGRVNFRTAAWLTSAIAGHDPKLVIRDIALGTNTVVAVDYYQGLQYQLEVATDLETTNWTPIISTTVTQAERLLLSGSVSNAAAYYRVKGFYP